MYPSVDQCRVSAHCDLFEGKTKIKTTNELTIFRVLARLKYAIVFERARAQGVIENKCRSIERKKKQRKRQTDREGEKKS